MKCRKNGNLIRVDNDCEIKGIPKYRGNNSNKQKHENANLKIGWKSQGQLSNQLENFKLSVKAPLRSKNVVFCSSNREKWIAGGVLSQLYGGALHLKATVVDYFFEKYKSGYEQITSLADSNQTLNGSDFLAITEGLLFSMRSFLDLFAKFANFLFYPKYLIDNKLINNFGELSVLKSLNCDFSWYSKEFKDIRNAIAHEGVILPFNVIKYEGKYKYSILLKLICGLPNNEIEADAKILINAYNGIVSTTAFLLELNNDFEKSK